MDVRRWRGRKRRGGWRHKRYIRVRNIRRFPSAYPLHFVAKCGIGLASAPCRRSLRGSPMAKTYTVSSAQRFASIARNKTELKMDKIDVVLCTAMAIMVLCTALAFVHFWTF